MASAVSIPTIDLSCFFLDEYQQEDQRKKKEEEVREMMKQACSNYGLFQVVNHGIPINLLNQTMELCKEFFDQPYEDKHKVYTQLDAPCPIPLGYIKFKGDKKESFITFNPETTTNVYPSNPPNIQFSIEELFKKFRETCQILEGVLNDCLGLPPNLLKDYNDDRCMDLLVTWRYFPATKADRDNGSMSHQDPNVLCLIFQDEVEGLEILVDGEWIPVDPIEGALVFHISDVLQVLTNDKFVSPFHQVMRCKDKNRHAFVFFYNLSAEKWVEPLPQFTKDIGELPKYKGFYFRDYFAERVKEKINPPDRHEDKTKIGTFASAT